MKKKINIHYLCIIYYQLINKLFYFINYNYLNIKFQLVLYNIYFRIFFK